MPIARLFASGSYLPQTRFAQTREIPLPIRRPAERPGRPLVDQAATDKTSERINAGTRLRDPSKMTKGGGKHPVRVGKRRIPVGGPPCAVGGLLKAL